MRTEIILYKQQLAANPNFSLLSDYGWSFTGDIGIDWSVVQNTITKIPGNACVLFQEGLLLAGIKYEVKFNVSSRTAGSIALKTKSGGSTFLTASSNARQSVIFTADGTDVRLEANSSFDGTISSFSIHESPETISLDLTDDVSVPMTFSIDDIRFPEKRTTAFSKTIELPATHRNNEALARIYEISSEATFNPNKQARAILKGDGITAFDGVLCLDDIILKNYQPFKYQVSFLGNVKNIFSIWGNKKVSELDYSQYDHLYDTNHVSFSWRGIVDVNGSQVSNMALNYTSPAITGISSVNFNGVERVKVSFATAHSFAIGDDVFGECTNNLLSGNQSIVDVDTNSITLNLVWSALTDTGTTAGVFTDRHFEGWGYFYPMIDMGTMNATDKDDVYIINGSLVPGVNYTIIKLMPGDSFTASGAQYDLDGLSFTANATPATWTHGSKLSPTNVSNWRVNEFFAGIFLKEILDKSFALAGYSYDAPVFDSRMFKRAMIPFSKGKSFNIDPDDLNSLLFRASMQDTLASPNGHTFETAYNLYPLPANHGDYPYDNDDIAPGTVPPQPTFWTPFYQNKRDWAADFNYDGFFPAGHPLAGSLYFDGQKPGGSVTFRNWFVEGCKYLLVNFNAPDDFTPVGGPNTNNTQFTSTTTGQNSGNWVNSSTIQPLSPFASHHHVPQGGGTIATLETTPIPFNHDQPPTDFDNGNHFSTVLYQYEMVPCCDYSFYGIDFIFSFSANVSNFVKDLFAYNGVSGDLPADYAGASAPGIYTTYNGTYVGGTNAIPASNERTDVDTRFYQGIVLQKSTDGGSTWTNIKYFGTDGEDDPYSSVRFENTFVSGSVQVNLQHSDIVRIIGYSNLHFIALRSDGLPCRGASAGGSAGTGFTTAGGNGATGGPVKMTFKVDNGIFKCDIKDPSMKEGFRMRLNNYLPDIKIADLFISIMRAINLLVEFKEGNQLYIETRENYYDRTLPPIDWTSKLNIAEDISQKPMARFNAKNYIFTYKEGQDFYNADYKKNYGGLDNRLYGDAQINTDNDFVSETSNTELIFNPAVMVGPPVAYRGADRVISAIYNKNGSTVERIQSLNLLFVNIRGTDSPWNLISLANSGTNVNDVQWLSTDQFRFYPQATHMDNHLSPKYDLNFRNPAAFYFGYTAITINTLYDLYHKKFIDAITSRYSKLLTGKVKLSITDIAKLNFRYRILIDGNILLLSKIKDWDINSDGISEVEFLRL